MNYYETALRVHAENQGKLELISKVPVKTRDDLSVAYTPGVAEPCVKIAENPSDAYIYTMKGRTVAVVTDGSAVLGLGDIGAAAALPVMEGKAVLFKEFANVDAIPLCLDTQDVDEIIHTVKMVSPGLGGINLEDIAAPRCFEIEERLEKELDIPVFHDDQHGTAIVVCAAVINAYRLLGVELSEVKACINGAGAAGSAIAHMLLSIGVNDIVICDSKGIIHSTSKSTPEKVALAKLLKETRGYGLDADATTLSDAVKGRDLFIGVSAAEVLSEDDVKAMNPNPVIFAMANPVPEIMPHLALNAGAKVVGTGRSDFANQINNVLVFPGIFKGALQARAKNITNEMKLAAVQALADFVPSDQLHPEYVIPSPFEPGVADKVAEAVARAWQENSLSDS
ncbi:MAG: NADP-dependent malic enzyme [Candidatus Ancillula sp.]|nr:NADP-dependent malic enzyme [Candidatus Ancillula sp.]